MAPASPSAERVPVRCPACGTTGKVPGGAPRTIKCPKCAHRWNPFEGEGAGPAPSAVPTPPPAATPAPASAPSRPAGRPSSAERRGAGGAAAPTPAKRAAPLEEEVAEGPATRGILARGVRRATPAAPEEDPLIDPEPAKGASPEAPADLAIGEEEAAGGEADASGGAARGGGRRAGPLARGSRPSAGARPGARPGARVPGAGDASAPERSRPRTVDQDARARGAFGAGDVLSTSLGVWMNEIVTCLAIVLIAQGPFMFLEIMAVNSRGGEKAIPFLALAQVLAGLVATSGVAHVVFQRLRQKHAPLGAALSTAMGTFVTVLIATILTGIVVGFIAVVGIFGVAILMGITQSPVIGVLAGIPIAVIVFAVVCALWVVVPAAVVEQKGATSAMTRSVELTSGVRMRVFGVVFTLGMLNGITQAAVMGLAGPLNAVYVELVREPIFASLGAVASAVGYYKLRVAREGIGIDEIARVFD